MPRYRIIASNRYSDEYIVTAKDKHEAQKAVYDPDESPDAKVEEISSNCVGTDIMECELIEEKK